MVKSLPANHANKKKSTTKNRLVRGTVINLKIQRIKKFNYASPTKGSKIPNKVSLLINIAMKMFY